MAFTDSTIPHPVRVWMLLAPRQSGGNSRPNALEMAAQRWARKSLEPTTAHSWQASSKSTLSAVACGIYRQVPPTRTTMRPISLILLPDVGAAGRRSRRNLTAASSVSTQPSFRRAGQQAPRWRHSKSSRCRLKTARCAHIGPQLREGIILRPMSWATGGYLCLASLVERGQ